MKQEIGKALLVVFMDPDEDVEDKFTDWYNNHHVPERVSVPGILNARRFQLCEGEGAYKYLAVYELENEGVLHDKPYLEVRANAHPMDFKRPKSQRLVYRQIFPESGAFEDKSGPK